MYFLRVFYIILLLVVTVFTSVVSGKDRNAFYSPACGVLCDQFICTDSHGVSPALTEKYLGRKAAENLRTVGEYNPEEFTFSNGIFCDVKEKLCRDDRYFGADGRRSGKVNENATMMLFDCTSQ
ncbi:YcgJ family protein [Escherichia coli]|uniref:YcgJ family protein n=1 Tax=Escherichia coli TaxID=562 RepID=UPI001C407F2D|nr:YcgJ family protein [Escherichia coli]